MASKLCPRHHNQYDENTTCSFCDAEKKASTDVDDNEKELPTSAELEIMQKAELVSVAKQHGVDVPNGANKQEILDALTKHRAA